MSPIRKTDDFRAVEIESWDDYVQEEIAGMQARGELDNLPQQGKPIKIWKTDVNPEYDLAFSRLKNAGVMPMWMELDKEVGEKTELLWIRLDTIETEIRGMIAALKLPATNEAHPDPSSFWSRLKTWFRTDFSSDERVPPTMTSIIAARERARTRWLEQAAELDKKIDTYHASLPRGGEHLQRLRWLPQRAARVFDEHITLADWWEQ